MKSLAVAPTRTEASDDLGSRDSWQSMSQNSHQQGCRIRARLLTTLGIHQKQEQGNPAVFRPPPSLMRKAAAFSEPLKYEEEDENEDIVDLKAGGSSCSSNSTTSSSSMARRSVVAFDDEVSVVPIPKHQAYSKRIRSRLWCDKRELRSMAARNTLEYQAEGWHWKTVVEDEGFITMSTGERIHPVHLQRLLCSPFFRQP